MQNQFFLCTTSQYTALNQSREDLGKLLLFYHGAKPQTFKPYQLECSRGWRSSRGRQGWRRRGSRWASVTFLFGWRWLVRMARWLVRIAGRGFRGRAVSAACRAAAAAAQGRAAAGARSVRTKWMNSTVLHISALLFATVLLEDTSSRLMQQPGTVLEAPGTAWIHWQPRFHHLYDMPYDQNGYIAYAYITILVI